MSRSNNAKNAKSALSRLQEERAARAAGKKLKFELIPEEDDVYDVLDEDAYQDLVSKRGSDVFVIDDDGNGYADDGAEDWMNVDEHYDAEDVPATKSSRKKQPKNFGLSSTQQKVSKKPVKVDAAFLQQKTKVKAAPVVAPVADQLDMLIANLDDDFSDSEVEEEEKKLDTAEDVALFGFGNEEVKLPEAPQHTPIVKKEAPVKQEPVVKQEPKEVSLFDVKLEEQVSKKAKVSEVQEIQSVSQLQPSILPSFRTSNGIDHAISEEIVFVNDNELLMYWLDAYEDANCPGTVFLVGKIQPNPTAEFVSCCVRVSGIPRNAFVLPRATHRVTGEPVDTLQVYQEFVEIAKFHGVHQFGTKPVKRKYAFSQDDLETPIPVESSEYLKVVYPATFPKLPNNLSGDTFQCVKGTSYSCLELFILKRKLFGPGWLKITNFSTVESQSKVSWCKAEYAVSSHKLVEAMQVGIPANPPKAVVMSLQMKTVINPKTKAHEVAMISWLVHRQVDLEGPSVEAVDSLERFVLVRKLTGKSWPFDLQSTLKQRGMTDSIKLFDSERAMLSFFLVKMQQVDPDILLGHDIGTFDLDVLLHRFHEFKFGLAWSKLGRLHKKHMPPLRSKSTTFGPDNATIGRLVCDIHVSAKEFVRVTNYSLSSLTSKLLESSFQDVQPSLVPGFFEKTGDLLNLVDHCVTRSLLTLQLMFKLAVLPLTKQLTCLCGNLWSQSLRSQSSNRVEFLLLHEFHREKYLVPERLTGAERRKLKEQAEGETGSSKKPKYSGGLVLEPKKGLYDQFVLVLDFNSLYPSIIQEYDVCFTTLDHWLSDDAGNLPIPEKKVEMVGILPRLIQHLVQRRRSVKDIIKSTTDPAKSTQLDIRQKALKLVANSMYGCLGFQNSRFHCRPLAALVTSLGRMILSDTVDLATRLGYDIIYGDTDSIMVNTRTTNLDEARTIGKEVIKEVNKLYSKLEIDCDGVYKRMLLLRKKRYAALMVHEDKDKNLTLVKELKGLDLVRRDWCPLSKELGLFVVDEILSGTNQDDIECKIEKRLEEIAVQVKANEIPSNKFIITKSLTKSIQQYPDPHALPHVHVATQMISTGRHVSVGDHIPYIILDIPGSSLSERAVHPYIYQSSKEYENVAIDFAWYLSSQLLAPVSRLCEPLEGLNSARLALALGLDASQYMSNGSGDLPDIEALADEFTVDLYEFDNVEAFPHLNMLTVNCRYCSAPVDVMGMCGFFKRFEAQTESGELVNCFPCPTNECQGFVRSDQDFCMVLNALVLEIKACIAKYYKQIFICDTATCDYHLGTRHLPKDLDMSCPREGCAGTLSAEYPSDILVQQLRFFQRVFDFSRVQTKARERRLSLSIVY